MDDTLRAWMDEVAASVVRARDNEPFPGHDGNPTIVVNMHVLSYNDADLLADLVGRPVGEHLMIHLRGLPEDVENKLSDQTRHLFALTRVANRDSIHFVSRGFAVARLLMVKHDFKLHDWNVKGGV